MSSSWRWAAALATSLAGSAAPGATLADSQVHYGPAPAWVRPVAVPAAPPAAAGGAATQVLVVSQQSRFSSDGDQFYSQFAFRILAPQALSVGALFAPAWNPEIDSLAIHRFQILRGGAAIDLLDGGKKITVIRREQNLDRAMLDGSLTATAQPEGLRVGDIVEIALTLTHRDPVARGHSEQSVAFTAPGPLGRVVVRESWPASKPIRWKATPGRPAPSLVRTASGQELDLDLADFTPPKPPADAPPRFQTVGQLQLSDFASWAEVAALLSPLYDKASTLAPDSPLLGEVERIRRSSADPKARGAAALRLVQDQVRYAFIGMNLGGYTPADADITWKRRFGDCKGKTALLLALLKGLGIEAEATLVSTTSGDGLDERLPGLEFFDHVIVAAHIGGRTWWFDGTRIGDRDLDGILTPDFHWGLPVLGSGAQLVKLVPAPLGAPAFEAVLRLDATAGLDAPAPAHAEQVVRGDDGVGENLALTNLSAADAEAAQRKYWRDSYAWIDVKAVGFAYDDAKRTLTMTMDGSATMDWPKGELFRQYNLDLSGVGFTDSFKREPGPNADAPFAVPWPLYKTWTEIVALPARGEGFSLLNAQDIDRTVAGRRFQRHSRLENGVATVQVIDQSVAPEFPAAEAPAASRILRGLSDYDVMIRAPSRLAGTESEPSRPAAPGAAPEAGSGTTPTTAGDYARRGEGYLVEKDFTHAIADLAEATKRAPTVGKNFYNLAVARFENGDDAAASADFDEAIRLAPTDVTALTGRARFRLYRRQDALAAADFAEVARLAPGDATLVREALIYENAGRYAAAIGLYDGLIAKGATAANLNGRCWARAEWGQQLAAALADCEAALALEPASAPIMDSRGLVLLRLGRFEDAVKAYGAALDERPGLADSLFGRGVAEMRSGAKAQGLADLAAARQHDPRVEARYARFGVSP